mgnify:CR=1 FL=1
MQDITSELGVARMLEKLLGGLAGAIGTTSLSVELTGPPAVTVVAPQNTVEQPRSVLTGSGAVPAEDWTEVEWKLPLTIRGRSLGVMIARHVLPPGAKADEEQLLKIVADQVAIAAENGRLYEGVMRRAAEQESLVESGRLLTGTLLVSEVLSRLSELVRSRFGADVARILISDDAPGVFRLHAQAGTTRTARRWCSTTSATTMGSSDGSPSTAGRSPTATFWRSRASSAGNGSSEGVVSVLGLPLFLESELVGVLTILYRTRHVFTPEELALGEALATSASVAIRNARLHEQTEERLRPPETLLAVSQDASSTLELTEILRRTTRAMVRALGADTGGAWLLSEDGSRFVPIVGYHVPKELLGALATANLKSLDPRVSDWRRIEGPVYASHSQDDPRFHPSDRPFVAAQVGPHPADAVEGGGDRRLRASLAPGAPSLHLRGAEARRGHRAAGRSGERELAPVRGRQAADGRAQAHAGAAHPVDQARRDRRAGGEHRPRDQQSADERPRLRVVPRRADPARPADARGARPDPGRGRPRP